MPIYEYKCNSCNYSFRVRHSMNTLQECCTKCNSKDIEKQVSNFNTDPGNNIFAPSSKKVGAVVNSHIEEAKREIKKEKDKLKRREL